MEDNKKPNSTKFVLNALFDVRPVNQRGDLDMEKIVQVKKVLDLRNKKNKQKIIQIKEEGIINLSPNIEELPTKEEIIADLEHFDNFDNLLENAEIVTIDEPTKRKELSFNLEEFYFPEVAKEKHLLHKKSEKLKKPIIKIQPKSLIGFIATGFLIALIIPTAAWLSQGLEIKKDVLSSSMSAYENLMSARESLDNLNWQAAEQNFGSAYSDFYQAHKEINKLGRLTLGILEQLPGSNVVSSGNSLVKVGEYLAQAGQGLASAVNLFSYDNLFNLIDLPSQESTSLTDLMANSQKELIQALSGIGLANQELENVKIGSLPRDIQDGIVSLKEKLPLVEKMLSQAKNYSQAFLKILGHDNPKQYLLIFQNNSEIRATGGFIGTYGLLTLDRGSISSLFVDGIYNADGQLHEKIIPPRPIQKVSTSWSMHDANWFADFPTSAEKIQWFYEKTGGPTTDGIISLTPILIERLLEITGSIPMPEYDVVLDVDNFVELIQYKVEIDYNKELNRPKKILADFAPLFIKKLSELSFEEKRLAIEIIFDCLEEKHILIYFNNSYLENLVIDEGWSGQLSSVDKDYLSVVSSNINGFKTDRMVEETIEHQAEIQSDGSIIDTLTITREHKGGEEIYDWWNRVNSNYLRVYLPEGSELISANGHSLEIYQPPIDYQEQGFKKDLLVNSIESGMIIDKKTGTRIFKENNKTVFGNWVYVSPGEQVVLTYKYKLPFKIDLTKGTDSYSLLAQKQLGSLGSDLKHKLKFPENWEISWKYPDNLIFDSGITNFNSDLKTDKFLGVTFKF